MNVPPELMNELSAQQGVLKQLEHDDYPERLCVFSLCLEVMPALGQEYQLFQVPVHPMNDSKEFPNKHFEISSVHEICDQIQDF